MYNDAGFVQVSGGRVGSILGIFDFANVNRIPECILAGCHIWPSQLFPNRITNGSCSIRYGSLRNLDEYFERSNHTHFRQLFRRRQIWVDFRVLPDHSSFFSFGKFDVFR